MSELFATEVVVSFFQVVLIDLTLAGDNAIVIGLAAAGLPREQRTRAILIGIGAATVLRIAFAVVTTQLLGITGLLFAGGILLLWVCWKLWRELRPPQSVATVDNGLDGVRVNANGTLAAQAPRKTLSRAATQILIADVSMSLDNVLAVAGAAREHPVVLVFGLGLSIVLMGISASFIARLLQKHRWIAFVGLLVILYVAVEMIVRGAPELQAIVDWAASLG